MGVSPQTTEKRRSHQCGLWGVTRPDPSQGWDLDSLSSFSPLLWVNSDGPGFIQTLGDDHIAERAIEPGDLNDIEALVGPVDVA